jgi:hypothetical protein
LLEKLYQVKRQLVLTGDYLMADETTIKVLDRAKKETSHLGYHWIYMDPVKRLVLFDYCPGRGHKWPKELLKNFKGYLQTDGWQAYDQFETGAYPDITCLACMAHARRYFYDAQNNDPERAKQALVLFQELYEVEREARENRLSHAQRLALRQEKSLPVLKKIKEWLQANLSDVTPQSPIGKAITYSLGRWNKLTGYTLDGKLEIDNNLAENAIRPIALGRKNYLFAGSHEGARRAAMLYSFLASCKQHHVNPREWLIDVFTRIKDQPEDQFQELLPHRWQPKIETAGV